MKFQSMTISFALLTLVGCKNIFEDNDLTLDGSAPYSEVEFPKKNNVYKASEPFRLGVGYSDKDNVEELDVTISQLSGDENSRETTKNVIAFKQHPNKKMFNLDTTFVANTFTAGKYKAVIKAMDTRKNIGTQEVVFSIK